MSTTWNPQRHEDYDALKGKDVYSADNEKIGRLEQVMHPANQEMPQAKGSHYFLVKGGPLGGLLGTDELYIPETAVQMFSEDRLVLEVPKERIKERDWTTPPTQDFRRS